MRTESELIQLLLDSGKTFMSPPCYGLCMLVNRLFHTEVISNNERYILFDIIRKNEPIDRKYYIYYFPIHEWQPRKEYLEQLLIKYKR